MGYPQRIGRVTHLGTAYRPCMANAGGECTPQERCSQIMTDTTDDMTESETRGTLDRLRSKLTLGRRQSRAMQAVWNGAVIAESDDTVVLEGNHYFPAVAVSSAHVRPSSHETTCPWKGVASYYDVVVDGDVRRSAAWYYAEPSAAARKIAGRVAFSPEVEVRPAP